MVERAAAVVRQAAPRFTNDVDAVIRVEDSRWAELLHSAAAFEIEARRPDVLDFAARARVLRYARSSSVENVPGTIPTYRIALRLPLTALRLTATSFSVSKALPPPPASGRAQRATAPSRW